MTAATGTASSFWSGWIQSEGQQEQSIKIKPIYIDINDNNLTDGVIFSQIVYWHTPDKEGKSRLRVIRDGHLWLAKSYDDWWKECRIPERTARASLTRIEKRGLIERHVWQFNGVPTVHVRIITDAFELAVKKVDPSLIRLNQPNGSGKTGQMVSAKSDTSFKTENTTETTKESPQPPTETVAETPEPAESKAAQERGGEGEVKPVKVKPEKIPDYLKNPHLYAQEPVSDELFTTLPLTQRTTAMMSAICWHVERSAESVEDVYRIVTAKKSGMERAYLHHLRQVRGATPKKLAEFIRQYRKDPYGAKAKDPALIASRFRDTLQPLETPGESTPAAPRHNPDCQHCKGKGYIKVNPKDPLSDMRPCSCRTIQNGGAK